MPLHHVEDLDLLQCGGPHLLQLLDCHLLRCDLNDLHCQLLACVSVHTPAHHTAHTSGAAQTFKRTACSHELQAGQRQAVITLLHWDLPANHLFRVILLVKLLSSHPVRQFISNNDVLGHDGGSTETNRVT